jgi:hypothetical protein
MDDDFLICYPFCSTTKHLTDIISFFIYREA